MPQPGMEELLKIVDESQKTGSKATLDLFAMQCQGKRQEAIEGRKKLKQEMQDNIKAAGDDKMAAREAKRKGEDAIDAYINGIDPFYKPYCLAWEIAQKFSQNKNVNWRNPGKDVGDIMDAMDVPVEDKLQLLYIMRENARENLYRSGLNVKGKSDLVRMEGMGNYQEKYGVGKKVVTKDPNGKVSKIELDDDIFAHNFGNMSNCFMLMFSDKYKGQKDQGKIKREESRDIADFCDKKITEYHLAILSGNIKTGQQPKERTEAELQGAQTEERIPDPYFSGASFQKNQRSFAEKKELLENYILSDEGKKEFKSAQLFGRGSDKFDRMQESYKTLQEAMQQHTVAPSTETLKKLEEQARLLNERVNLYLDYKHKQIDDGTIKGTKTPDGQGGFTYRAEKSSTQTRMDFAQNLKRGLAELNGYIQRNQAKTMEKNPSAGPMMR